jgi:proliferating cell nuclear antigen PCNA
VGRERISMVNMVLNAKAFQNFYVESDMILGVNLINLNSLLRSVGSHDTLTLFINKTERNKLGIKLQDAGKNKVTKFMLDLIELDYVVHDIPDMTPQSVITMPSSDFQQTCRALGLLTDSVDIQCAGNQISFKGKGDFAEQITAFGETEDGIIFNEKTNPLRPV